MIRILVLVAALAACAPTTVQGDASALADCGSLEFTGALEPRECKLDAAGQLLHVTFAPIAEGAQAGAVTIDVLGDDGAAVQTMFEPDVLEYRAPSIQDVDGDGRADILVARETGNVNTAKAIWIFNGERGVYERVGDVSGVSIERTSDGLIAVPARSSAVAWNVAFYKLDEGGLHPLATVSVEAPSGRSTEPTCTLTEAPGLHDLNLTEQAAQQRFCAEPAAQVFAP